MNRSDLERPAPPSGGLRARREAAGLSLQGLAVRSGYSRSYLSRVENGRRAPTPAVVRIYTELTPAGAADRTPMQAPTPASKPAPTPPPRRAPRHIPAAAGPDLGVTWFGSEVRRLRMAAGKSLDALGSEVFLSRPYLGKIEQGDARANYQLALSLDAALDARGSLTRLFLEECARVGPVAPDTDILSRGPERAAEGTADPAERAAAAAVRLQALRIRSHQAGPHSIVGELGDGVVELHGLVGRAGPGAADPVWPVMLRYAELLGWTAQETGHDAVALRWTRAVADWARALGDADALGYALVRHSQWARRRGDAVTAAELARQAGAVPGISWRIAQFVAQREAQACALARDEAGFRRALDRYHALLAAPPHGETSGESAVESAVGSSAKSTREPLTPWGPAPDPVFERSHLFEATCLVDLADFRTAASLFDRGMTRLLTPRTGYSRLAVRQAIACAHVGELDQACHVMREALPTVSCQGSASLRGDLKALIRVLNRHRRAPAVRALLPDLTSVARARNL
ncbi:helix-turn-helix transcriptional regulator [Streptacidiphilus melanogenes]|uniref:helix-turn-helix transcriptional regulator n=1 Tax=Streptacidiphilus melanogenes TaxID=411235 RepID=UPI000A93F7D4|nr:helix-turn-helix transcriptional regulator [Streptacidiphilus melanogenes]